MRNIWLATSNGEGLDLGGDTNKALFKQDIKENVGKKYRIERVQHKRSLSQNNYFWFYLELVEQETGNDKHALHEYTKKYLTPKKEVTLTLWKDGKQYTRKGIIGKGTSELTKIEMGDVLDKLCADTGVALPNPQDAGYIKN